jgi:hypothetical protein
MPAYEVPRKLKRLLLNGRDVAFVIVPHGMPGEKAAAVCLARISELLASSRTIEA